MADLWLVRHGQAGDLLGDYDRLSERGWAQARRAGEGWKHLGEIHHVVTGGMRRHQETAVGFGESFGALPAPREDVDWNEFDHQAVLRVYAEAEGPPQGPGRRAFFTFFTGAMARWTSGEHDDDYPEAYKTFQERVVRGLDDVTGRLSSGQKALVFTSGGVISSVVRHLLGLDPMASFRVNTVLMNTSFTRVRVGPGVVSLVSLNVASHLDDEPELITLA